MKKYTKYFIIAVFIIAVFVSVCFIPINASRLIPMVEEQISNNLGVKIHVERLILRLGPSLKLKAPIMYIMQDDGKNFARFDNVKFYLTWTSLFKKSPFINLLQAKKLTITIASDDEFISNLINNIETTNFNEIPNIQLNEYNFTFYNKASNDKYILDGQNLTLNKILNYKNFKLKTKGSFSINSQKFISYDLVILPNITLEDLKLKFDIIHFIEQIRELDFHSDIIADIKLYQSSDKLIQASGFINVDNISVLDTAKKNPKSFVYLTFLGNRASVLSNIYTSQNKKVYIEGMINNSIKPVLDLKVKTDEIAISELYKKLKILTDFSYLKNIESVEGSLNANFTLKGDLNKIKSNGYMKIANAGFKADGIQVDRINSEIDFSNNIINVTKTMGYVNNSPIYLKGVIDKEIDLEFLMNKVDLKYLCPTKWGVKRGNTSIIANIKGSLDNLKHKENISIDNFELENDSLSLNFDSFKIDTNKSNTATFSNIVCNTSETEPIKIPTMKLILDSNNIKIPETNIFMPNSKLSFKSDIVNYNNPALNHITILNGFINTKDINKLSNFSTRYPIKLLVNGNKTSQNVTAQLLLEKTDLLDEPAVLNLASKFDKNAVKIDDLSLVSFTGKFSDDLKNNLKGSKKILLNGLIENYKDPVFKNFRIFIPQQLSLNLADMLIQLKGDLFVSGNLKKPDIIGQINLQNLFNQALQLSLSNCTMDFNKTNLVLNAPQVKISDSSISVNALVSTDISEAIVVKNANIKSKYLNTDTLLMYKDTPLIRAYPVKILDSKFYAERILANLYSSPLYLSAFTSDLSLNNEHIILKNISSELYNGKISGSLDYSLRDEIFDSNFMARGVSAEPIFNTISSKKEAISGNMNFDANIKGELTSKQSLNGNIKFIINNGRMSRLGKLEHLLYAQNVIADNMLRTSLNVVTKAITLKDTGLFKDLRGDIDLVDGIAEIKLLQSQGPLMALFIKGKYNPINDFASMTVLGRLSDEVISGLGAFGDFSFSKLMVMLTGEEEKQKILPADFDKIPQLPMKNTKEFCSIINGTLDKPSSVVSFNWVSYSQKDLKQKEVPMTEVKVPEFINSLPY